jgi:hypothetical protein
MKPSYAQKSYVPVFFLALVLFSFTRANLPSQTDSEISGLVLVNCVASDQPVMATFSGKPVLLEPGLAAGSATSGLGVPTGAGVLQVTHPEFGSAEISLEIAKGATPIVVVYAEKEPATSEKKAKLVLRQTQSNPSTTASFSLVFVADRQTASLSATANGKPLQLAPWRPQKIESANLRLEASGAEIYSTEQEGPAAWYVFVAAKQGGDFLAVGVPQTIYEW